MNAKPKQAELEHVLRRGYGFVDWLRAPDGTWGDFLTQSGESVDWVTGYIGSQLKEKTIPFDLDRCVAPLLRFQQQSGGWGYHQGVPVDADSTAWCLNFLAGKAPADALSAGIRCLLTHQRPSGGFATYAEPGPIRTFVRLPAGASMEAWCTAHPDVTASALIALVTCAHAGPEVERAVDYLNQTQRTDGSWPTYWWVGDIYSTSMSVTTLAHIIPNSPRVREGRTWLRSQQQPDGSWSISKAGKPSAFATALSCLALSAPGALDEDQEAAIRGGAVLVSLQEQDGGWPSEPVLQIPPPDQYPAQVSNWRLDGLGTAVWVSGWRRAFVSATACAAIAAGFVNK